MVDELSLDVDQSNSVSPGDLVQYTVRLVNRDSPPDVEFAEPDVIHEALRHRRIDPERLLREIGDNPAWVIANDGAGRLQVSYPGSTAPVT